MAQLVSDIQAEMITEKANHPELTPLNSTSNVSIWRLWMFVTATIIVFFEQVMDLFKKDIQAIIDSNEYGTDPWWYNKIIAFQYGDLLSFINNIFQYAVIDPTKNIVGFCSISSLNGIVQIKVAANVGGVPVALSPPQITGIFSYCSQIQPSGVRFAILSTAPDLLQFFGNIYYDASGDITVIQPAVEAAIVAFINSKANNNFNGTLYVNNLIDQIQAVTGLVGNKVDVLSIAAKNSGGAYAAFTSSCQPESGYFMIDPAYPLNVTLTYIPYIAV